MSLTRLILLATLAIPLAAQPSVPKMIEGAKRQVGVTRSYDPTYRRIGYPNGDVPRETGVCTDVVIRAYRHAGTDLQVLVHEDMKRAFSAYPKNWDCAAPTRTSIIAACRTWRNSSRATGSRSR